MPHASFTFDRPRSRRPDIHGGYTRFGPGCEEVGMSKTLIDVDDELLERAREILGPGATKKDAVNAALGRLVRLHDQREAIEWITATDPIADLRDPAVRASARR